ncbi:MAG TPA: diguanylate cyclase [Noviherbaspirillum sp.]
MQTTTKTRILYVHWLILAIALLLIVLSGVFHSYQERHRAQHNEEDRLLAQARAVQENVAHNLQTIESVLVNVQGRVAAGETGKGLGIQLRTLTDAMPAVRTLLVVDAGGTVVVSSRPELTGLDVTARAYYQTARHHPDPAALYVSSPFRTSTAIFSVALSKMIPDREGRFAGLVVATLDPDYFSTLLNSVRYTRDMLTAIAHWDGTLFMVSPEQSSPVGISLNQPGTVFNQHRDSGKDATVFSGSMYATDARMIAQRTIRPAGLNMDQPLVVAVSRKLDGIYATWRTEAQWMAALFAMIAAASGAGLYAYQRQHLRSAAKEAEAMRAVEASERFMKALADHIPGLVAYWTDELRCSFSNAAYLEWFGKTPEQMRNIALQELLGEALFRKNEPYVRGALRGEPQLFERTLTKADGSIGYTLAQYIPDKRDGKVNGFVVLVSDVTRLKMAEFALAESEWKLKTIIEAEPECVTVLSGGGAIQRMNRAGLEMIGADAETDVIGTHLGDLVDPPYRAAFNDIIGKIGQNKYSSLTFELTGRKSVHRWLEMHAVCMPDPKGGAIESLCVIRDISDRKKAEVELEKLAQTDFLTGLANRRHFMVLAEQELLRTHRYGSPLSVLMIDIDHFKRINDTYGHKTGDLVLKEFAGLCQHALRSIDIIGRLGGEEFGAVLPETDLERAAEVARRLCELVAGVKVLLDQGMSLHFTVSIGVTSVVEPGCNMDTLLNRADTALYEAKNAGRNKVCVYMPADMRPDGRTGDGA